MTRDAQERAHRARLLQRHPETGDNRPSRQSDGFFAQDKQAITYRLNSKKGSKTNGETRISFLKQGEQVRSDRNLDYQARPTHGPREKLIPACMLPIVAVS